MRGIGAGLGLRQCEGCELLPLGQVRQPAPLLLLRTEEDDGLGTDRGVDVEDHRRAGAEARDFLDEDRERQVVEPGAAVRVGDQDAEQAELGGLVNQVPRELAVVIDRFGARPDLALGEIPNELANLLLFRAEGEIHYGLVTRTMVASPCAIPEQMPAAP